MTNRARGETSIEVPGIGSVTLCLTLAGMAELEDAFEVDNIQQAVAEVGENPSSKNMATIIHALIQGTEHEHHTVDEIRKWAITPGAIREAMSAMNAANEDEPGNEKAANRKERRAQESKKAKE